MLETIFAVLVSLASIAVIVVILLQSGKEAGLGAIAGGSETYLNKSKGKNMDQVLASATKWIALVWVVLVLFMSLV